jgi:uncharacterized protein YacL (UPF0231 family)
MINYYIDRYLLPRVRTPNKYKLLSTYLEQDIQGSITAIDALLYNSMNAKENHTVWEWTGNAHTIIISSNAVLIINEYDDSFGELNLDLDFFIQSLLNWKKLVQEKQESNQEC